MTELVAELRDRDGRTRSVRVPVRCSAEEGEGGQLRGLRRGLAELQERVVELLAPLVQEEREAAGGGGPRGEWRGERAGGGVGAGKRPRHPPGAASAHPRPA